MLYFVFRCLSITIHGTVYRRHCWLLIGKESVHGVPCPTFGHVVDILSLGEQQIPLFIIQPGKTTAYMEYMRAYSVQLAESVPNIVFHPSSLLYYHPFTTMQKGTQYIIKAKVDLYSFLES